MDSSTPGPIHQWLKHISPHCESDKNGEETGLENPMQDGQANSHFGETFVGIRGFEPITTSSLQVEWETDPPCGTIAYPWEGDGEESVVYTTHGQGEQNVLETAIPQ